MATHIDPKTKTYDGTSDFLITKELYESLNFTTDRIERSKNLSSKLLENNLIEFKKDYRSDLPSETGKDTFIGRYIGTSKYWVGFDNGTSVAYFLKEHLMTTHFIPGDECKLRKESDIYHVEIISSEHNNYHTKSIQSR